MFGKNNFYDNFNEPPLIVNASDHHMALLFLLDTSASMGAKIKGKNSTPLNQLTNAINRFKAEVCKDEHTKDILDIAIVEFNSQFRILQEFTPVEYMKPIELEPYGATYLAPPMNVAINMVAERSRFYRRAGAEPYKPWIILITDGLLMDKPEVTRTMISNINSLVEQEKLAVWSLVAGDASDNKKVLDFLHQLCGKRVLKLAGYDFDGFLDWANKSMRAVSQSVPGEKIKGQQLPNSVSIAGTSPNNYSSYSYVAQTLETPPPLSLSVTSLGCDNIGALLDSMNIPYKSFRKTGFNCDMLFVNCLTLDRVNAQHLRSFVENGGCLYASCYADKLIKKAFPNIFVTDHSGEPHYENVIVEDLELRERIGSSVTINFDTVWAKLYGAEGENCILRSSETGKPIMISVRYGKGVIFYTCFHNHAQASEEEKILLKMMVLRQIGEVRDKTLEEIGNEYGIDLQSR